MSHLPDPVADLTPEGKRIYERIVGSRGHDWPGLFRTLMIDPELAERFAHLGELLRFGDALRPDVRELAILCVARELWVAYIWETHLEFAARAGLPPQAVEAVMAGGDLAPFDPLFGAVRQLVRCYLDVRCVPQELQDSLVAVLGPRGFLLLSVVIGYYKMIAGLAVGLEFPLPPGMTDPFRRPQPGPATTPITYTVAVTFTEAALVQPWLRWLREGHIAEVLSGGASSAEVVALDEPAGAYEVRYRFPSREAFQRYEREHAPRLRAEGQRLFPPEKGVIYQRSVGVIAGEFPPSP
jgi:4-carboxymuconolactone decarboxylase